ncbi:MAG: PIN domain-containing protein [Candidatus Aenigmatarchaeota archaeon]
MRAVTKLSPLEIKKGIEKTKLDLTCLREIFSLFEVLPCNFGIKTLRIIEKYKLLPNDAIIAATCKYYRIRKIATFDEDFKKVNFLEIFEI